MTRTMGQGEEAAPIWPLPPAQVEPYVAVLGEELTVAFLLAFGGAELALSRDPRGRGMVEALVGEDKARALAAHPALTQRRVPLAKPWLARCLAARGHSAAAIARKLHVSDVSARRWLRGRNEAHTRG